MYVLGEGETVGPGEPANHSVTIRELGPVLPPACPSGPSCQWISATNADVARDQTVRRYRAFLSLPVGTQAHEMHNGNFWKFRVVSKATDPSLTTFAKDVRGWICQPPPRVAALRRARAIAAHALAPSHGGAPSSACPPQGPPWHITGGTILIEGDHGGPRPLRFQLPLVGEPSKFTLTLSGTLIPRGITGVKPIGITIGINRFIAAIDGMGWVTLKDGTKVWGRKMEAPGVQHQDLLPEQNSKEVAFRFLWNVENNPW